MEFSYKLSPEDWWDPTGGCPKEVLPDLPKLLREAAIEMEKRLSNDAETEGE
jgi:hypothetical protein